jgi:hypothetical protein
VILRYYRAQFFVKKNLILRIDHVRSFAQPRWPQVNHPGKGKNDFLMFL